MSNYTVVINRFNEDINWLFELNKECSIFIYDKNINSDITCQNTFTFSEKYQNFEYIKLNNIGREAETYIRHIIKNYNNLDKNDITLFLQANPDNYSKEDIVNIVNNNLLNNSSLLIEPFSNKFDKCDINGYPNHPNLPLLNFLKHIQFYKDFDIPKEIYFNCNSQFAIKNKHILKHSLDYYKDLHKLCLLDKNDNVFDNYTKVDFTDINPYYYCFERFWKFIFK